MEDVLADTRSNSMQKKEGKKNREKKVGWDSLLERNVWE
jgi:hypothetical protein